MKDQELRRQFDEYKNSQSRVHDCHNSEFDSVGKRLTALEQQHETKLPSKEQHYHMEKNPTVEEIMKQAENYASSYAALMNNQYSSYYGGVYYRPASGNSTEKAELRKLVEALAAEKSKPCGVAMRSEDV